MLLSSCIGRVNFILKKGPLRKCKPNVFDGAKIGEIFFHRGIKSNKKGSKTDKSLFLNLF